MAASTTAADPGIPHTTYITPSIRPIGVRPTDTGRHQTIRTITRGTGTPTTTTTTAHQTTEVAIAHQTTEAATPGHHITAEATTALQITAANPPSFPSIPAEITVRHP